jgi:hypothetical protein
MLYIHAVLRLDAWKGSNSPSTVRACVWLLRSMFIANRPVSRQQGKLDRFLWLGSNPATGQHRYSPSLRAVDPLVNEIHVSLRPRLTRLGPGSSS